MCKCSSVCACVFVFIPSGLIESTGHVGRIRHRVYDSLSVRHCSYYALFDPLVIEAQKAGEKGETGN